MFVDELKLEVIIEGSEEVISIFVEGVFSECDVGIGEDDSNLFMVVSVEEAIALET